jgi:dipeptidyl-peptidase-3
MAHFRIGLYRSTIIFAAVVVILMQSFALQAGQETKEKDDFPYFSEQFADLRILRYTIPGFESLTLQQKKLAYYLSQAALSGRDIYWDQNYQHNLTIRRTLEQIMLHFNGDRNSDVFKRFVIYTKRIWFSNGIHHHYGNDKFIPDITEEELRDLILQTASANYPLATGETLTQLIDRITPVMFDGNIDEKKVCLEHDIDKVECSAVNFYEDGITEAEIQDYYKNISDVTDETPISYGLNSKKIKRNDQVVESVYKIDGIYGDAIKNIVYWLRLASNVAESDLQKAALEKLMQYYVTGDLRNFDEYNILWVQDTTSVVDTINGFIEVYDDPLGHNGSWEAVVSIKDFDATAKFGVLSHEAQWFENNSPIMPEHKRESVTGVSYKVVNVVQEAGSSSPATPIGINLPNADWIREKHGSKSVSLSNIEYAYSQASKETVLDEFFLPEQRVWLKQYGDLADRLHTGLHEVIGHASGKLEPGVLPPHDTLKSYASALEEARADLVGLYYIGDQHLVDIGVSTSTDLIKASYTQYITNGLLKQLSRIDLGKNIEEAHMRNRQMIAAWAYEHGQRDHVIERRDMTTTDGIKTHFVINDFSKLRELFGSLLREVQRIKSQGDYNAGRNLIENYGVQVDRSLHEQVKLRWAKLNIAPYAGFINPSLKPVVDDNGVIRDIAVTYPNDFTEQMLDYAKNHSWLPHYSQETDL